MQKDIETILIPLNVFSNYAYCVKISNFYFHFYYGKTSKEDPKKFSSGEKWAFLCNFFKVTYLSNFISYKLHTNKLVK